MYANTAIKPDADSFFLFNIFVVSKIIRLPNQKELGKSGGQQIPSHKKK
jgi:hypothetical protein